MLFGQVTEVDEMPYFAGCDTYKLHSKEKLACSMSNLAYYLNRHLVYPDSAKQKGISGIVYVTFTVEIDGKVSNVKVLNDIGEGCGKMAQKVVEEMPLWEPAVFKEKKVAYELRLPIQFTLDDGANYAKDFQLFWGDLRFDEIPLADIECYIQKPIVIRNMKGEQVSIITMLMVYENGKTLKDAKSKGEINKDMIKILRRAKPNSKITFTVTLQKKGSFFELFKTYNLK